MITIRQATQEDLPTLSYLFDQYRQHYHQQHDLQGARDFLQERMEREESVIFVAVSEGELIGFTQLYPIFSSVSIRRTWLLNDLFVAADQRGKGAGTLLLEAAKKMATDTGAKWMLLQTTEDNSGAQALYERNGWVREADRFYRFDID